MPYAVTIATTAGGLGTPMHLSPARVVVIAPDQIITASGLRKLNGLEGRELYWEIADPTDVRDIMDRTGGSGASSIAGFIRCKDWYPRSSSAETWSDYSCVLDQPVTGEYRVGNNRYNIKVVARRMTLYAMLA